MPMNSVVSARLFVTFIVTSSPSFHLSVGPVIIEFTAVATAGSPVMFTLILSMVRLNSVPLSSCVSLRGEILVFALSVNDDEATNAEATIPFTKVLLDIFEFSRVILNSFYFVDKKRITLSA